MSFSRIGCLSIALVCFGCSSNGTSGKTTEPQGDAGADVRPAAKRRVVTADWLNKSLTVLDYDKLVAGAATRDEALVRTIDLAQYEPGPIEVAVTPDGKTAVATVGPGFFAGALAPLVGATTIATTGTALIVDLETGVVVKEVPPPSPPMGVVITSDGKRAFTVDHGSTEGKTLSIIDLAEQKVTQSIEVGGSPEETALTPDDGLGVVNTDSNGSIRFFDPKDPQGTLGDPLPIGADPGGGAFVPSEHKFVIGKSLSLNGEVAGFSVVDVSNPDAPAVVDKQPLPGVSYGVDPILGTSRVLATGGVGAGPTGCQLQEIDVSTTPATLTRTIPLPCTKGGLPMSTAITRDGKHAFVGVPGDNSLMVVDVDAGTARRIPWLAAAGPTKVAVTE